ncbi:MAG: hypothetical protein Q4D29_10000 [Lachnospiraceae bacterium]|nr:hypothetical protein [Lachnospiraceae bacterium]
MAVSDEIKEQTKKFKDMTPRQKVDYIYTYYKWWILGALLIIIFISGTINAIRSNSREVYLYADFIDTTVENVALTCTLEGDFLQSVNLENGENYKSGFDYTIYMDNDYGNQQSMAGQVKLVSEYSAGQVDIVCGPESIMDQSADVGGYGNLSEILPAGMIDELKAKGFEPYYYTEKIYDDFDSEGNTTYSEGDTYIGGIYINNSSKLFGTESTCVYDKDMEEKYVLAIAWNTENIDHCIEFINYVTE